MKIWKTKMTRLQPVCCLVVRFCLGIVLGLPMVAVGMPQEESKQNAKAIQLVKKLGANDYQTRTNAGKQLEEMGSGAVDALFQAITDKALSAEARVRSGMILLAMSKSDDDELKRQLKTDVAGFDPKKYPVAKSILIDLRAELLGEVNISQSEAIEKLSRCGCRAFPRGQYIDIDMTKFSGERRDYQNILAIKDPIRLKIQLETLPDEFYELISKLHIQRLRFEGEPNVSEESFERIMKEVGKCTDIQSLSFDFYRKLPTKPLRWIGQLTQIKSLKLPPGANDETLKALSKLEQLHSLKFVNASGTNGSGFEFLSCHDTLMVLDLYHYYVSPENCRHLEKFRNLVWLKLNQNATDRSLVSVSKLKKLQNLNIDNTLISDKGLKKLAGLEDLKQIQIGESPVSNRSVELLNQIPTLERLYLNNTLITKTGFERIKCKGKNYNGNRFFESNSDDDYDLILKLLDSGIVIRPAYNGNGLRFLIRKLESGISPELVKEASRLSINELMILGELKKETVDEILQLKKTTRIMVGNMKTEPALDDKSVERLKNHFDNVQDHRQKD